MTGSTEIILTDVKTGKKDIYHDKNMITNALNDFFVQGGLMNMLPTDMDFVTKLLGGIMAFDSELEEDPDKYYVPGGINMVANGSVGTASNDAVTELGSYNASLSGKQADGSYVFTYDWGPSQANGTIKSCALTSQALGLAGIGNLSMHSKEAATLSTYGSVNNIVSTYYTEHCLFFDYADSSVIKISKTSTSPGNEDYIKSTGKVKFLKYRIPLTKIAIDEVSHSSLKLIDTIELDAPASFVNNLTGTSYLMDIDYDFYGNCYLIFYRTNRTFKVGEYIEILKICPDLTMYHYSVQNTSTNSYELRNIMIGSTGEYLYMHKRKSDYSDYYYDYRFNVETSAVEQLSDEHTDLYYANLCYKMPGRIFLKKRVIDEAQKLLIPYNVYSSMDWYPVLGNKLLNTNYDFQNLYRRDMFIASINNLEEQVVKTADKSMRISYRVTF